LVIGHSSPVLSVSLWLDFYVLCFRATQTQAVAAELKFKRVAERGRTDAADLDAGRHAHFKQAPAHFVGVRDSDNAARFADCQIGR
jgi:hypothetical protein